MEVLPAINASLNGLCAVLLGFGYFAIKRKAVKLHKRLMLLAFTTSAVFLVCYLVRVALTGIHRFPDVGLVRVVYLALLGSHVVLATLMVPFILRLLWLAWHGDFPRHRRMARFVWPVWMYVSITGVIVYWMLYHLAPRLAA